MNITTLLLGILVAEVTYLVYRSRPQLRSKARGGVFVDTSALMDGRIVTAAQTGFIPSHVVVPRSVINELQLLADQADPEKRSRARRGLDAVQELQDMSHLRVETIDDGALGKGGVDERLIDLAKRHRGSLCTIDFNLNKAATALGIRVLNINELAGNIRMAFLPGETITLALTQKGQSSSQAVGYLADGTMVVVDKASGKIGQTIEIEFIRSLQTAAGRMMFARPLTKLKSAQTRGEAESEGHMFARPLAQPRAERTRGEDKSEVQATAEPAQAPANSSAAAKQTPKVQSNRRSAGRKPKTVTQADDKPTESSSSKPTNQRRGRPSSRRKTHEDSLIELVNRQD
jgi:rRNA-processing protein FCF1